MSHIHVRVKDDRKKKAKKVLDKIGIDMSTAINLYLQQIVLTNGIPFRLVTENGFTPEAERAMLEESRQLMEDYKAGKVKAYSSAQEMMDDLLD